jgi:hypothetical protein
MKRHLFPAKQVSSNEQKTLTADIYSPLSSARKDGKVERRPSGKAGESRTPQTAARD